jgi:hypothetical protein
MTATKQTPSPAVRTAVEQAWIRILEQRHEGTTWRIVKAKRKQVA